MNTEHYTVEDTGQTLRFTFPDQKSWIVFTLLAFEGIFLMVFLTAFINSRLHRESILLVNPQWEIHLVDLLFLVILGLFMLGPSVDAAWLFAGVEIVEISASRISIQHKIFNFKRIKVFPAQKIDGVFTARRKSIPYHGRFRLLGFWFSYFKRGKIALNSGKTLYGEVNTYRFGSNITSDEVEHIVSLILTRFPQYYFKHD